MILYYHENKSCIYFANRNEKALIKVQTLGTIPACALQGTCGYQLMGRITLFLSEACLYR